MAAPLKIPTWVIYNWFFELYNYLKYETLFEKESKLEEGFTKREMDVLRLVVEGKNNTEIAHQLRISTHTTKVHVSSIINKFEAKNRVNAAALAVCRGMV